MKISHRIFLLILITILLSTLTNLLLTRHQAKVLHSDSEHLLAQTLVQSLRITLVQDVIDGNKLRVTNLLRNIKRHKNPIEFLYITNIGHQVFAHSFEEGFPGYLLHQADSHQGQSGTHLTHKFQIKQGLIFEYSEALIPGLDATLHIGINQTYIAETLAKNTQNILLISLTIMLLALFIAFFWSQRITRPLAQLAEQIQRFALGESVSFTRLEKADPEIRQLSSAFQTATTERQQALYKLEEREQNLAITLNSIGDAVITTDAKGNVTRMNPVAEQLTGWSFNDAQGQPVKSIFSIINASTRERIPNPVEKVLASGKTVYLSNHTTLIAKDGTEYHIADSAAPIRNGDDYIQGMVLIFNDISEQYRLREDLRTNQLLIQGLMDDLKSMVGIMQPDGRIAFINNMPLELSDVKKDSVIGELLWNCNWFSSKREMSKRIEVLCNRVAQGEAVTQDVQFQAKNYLIWMELSIYPVLDDDGAVMQMVFEGVDISQRKESEALQKNYQLTLEKQVHERTAELEKKAAELARATQLKSEFLANMSHELRTPMNSIIGFTGRVIKKASNKLETRQLNNLRTVERNAHHLLSLINGLLDLSKIEAGKMEAHAESFAFSTLVKEVFSLTQSMLEDKPIKFKTDIPSSDIQLHTDTTKLKQVLINLVSNAIKFTHDGSITIEAKSPSDGPEPQIAIRVIDTGVGMSEDVLQYIFDAFRQVDGTLTRKAGGTGLGLAIVRSFTELLRGTVSVTSEEGVGTSFKIVIPVNVDGSKASTEVSIPSLPQVEKYNGNKRTILCIDDEADALELLSGYLADEGYQVINALNGEEGLRLAKEQQPFAITLDILMPNKDGWSVLSELKADKETRNIPVIIISFIDNKALGYQLGAFDYMQKPINPQCLIASIHRLSQDSISNALVVDDDVDARNLMCQILEDTNIHCQTAVDGTDALSQLKRAGDQLPELILLDLMMPGMDGFELLQQMQKNPVWMEIPVIVVTAKTLVEHERDFLRPKVASILAKEGLTSEQVLKQLGVALKHFKENNSSRKVL